jgi:hypothetical protein
MQAAPRGQKAERAKGRKAERHKGIFFCILLLQVYLGKRPVEFGTG